MCKLHLGVTWFTTIFCFLLFIVIDYDSGNSLLDALSGICIIGVFFVLFGYVDISRRACCLSPTCERLKYAFSSAFADETSRLPVTKDGSLDRMKASLQERGNNHLMIENDLLHSKNYDGAQVEHDKRYILIGGFVTITSMISILPIAIERFSWHKNGLVSFAFYTVATFWQCLIFVLANRTDED